MAKDKPHMNMVVIGHVDHGKSTTVGRILYETGQFDAHTIEQYRKQADDMGKGTFEFAWVMDQLKEERERGLTIDVAHRRFDTPKYYFTIIDAPGHRDFVKNMITGTSQADCALLVVGAAEGVQAQTREHAFLAKTLGVPQLVVGINKMDATQPPYSEARYKQVKEEAEKLLKMVGYKTDQIEFIPISSYKGENISKPSENMPWWKGSTLLAALDKFQVPPKPTDKPLRLPVQDVYSITGVGTVPVGRIETGLLKVNDKIIFEPSHAVAEVKSIEMHHESMDKAEPGDNVGFNVRGVSKNDVKRGDVAGPVDNPPTVAKRFRAQIVVLQHPSAIAPGYTPVFHCHTAQVACTLEEIVRSMDPRSGQTKEEHPAFIKPGDVAEVIIRPSRPMVIEPAKDFPPLGRFAIRDMGMTVAAGVCLEILEKR